MTLNHNNVQILWGFSISKITSQSVIGTVDGKGQIQGHIAGKGPHVVQLLLIQNLQLQ